MLTSTTTPATSSSPSDGTPYPSWNCGGGKCSPNNEQAKTVLKTLQDAITKAGAAVGAPAPLFFGMEKLLGYLGPSTASYAAKITEKLPNPSAFTGTLATLYKNATSPVAPIAFVSDQALAVTSVMYDVALGKYGGVAAHGMSTGKKVALGLLAVGAVAGGVVLYKRGR